MYPVVDSRDLEKGNSEICHSLLCHRMDCLEYICLRSKVAWMRRNVLVGIRRTDLKGHCI